MYLRVFVAFLCLTATSVGAQQSTGLGSFAPLSAIPRPIVDADAVELGKMLFFDSRLSGDASTSCAECHNPDAGWTDGSDLARGYPGTKHWRNTQTVVNAALIETGLHWDGGLGSLSDQVYDAMGAGFVANVDMTLAEERLRQIPDYRRRFQAIWGRDPSKELLAEAIAAFEGSLISDDSPFDRHLAGEGGAMPAPALRGLEIFAGKGNCMNCHNGALLSDGEVHNIAVPTNPEFTEDPLRQVTFRYLMRLLGLDEAVYEKLDRDPGRFAVTSDPDDLGAFRTPPLRYLSYTAPYMHNGVFYTLDEVVEFYNIGGTQDVFGTKSPLIQPLGLTREEKQDLVAFLESLSGSEILVEAPDLPDYAPLPGPSAGAVITAAALRGDAVLAKAPTSASRSGLLPEAPPGLRIDTPAAGASGLTLIPRSSSKPATKAPGADSESGLRLNLLGEDAASAAPAAGDDADPSLDVRRASVALTEPASEDDPDPELEVEYDDAESERIEIVNGERFITVQRGDTLRLLAEIAYGDRRQYRKILEANDDGSASSRFLFRGRKLKLPE
ncbi:MAG: cytochrome c peroxidase [Pseudomonadota bacterium]